MADIVNLIDSDILLQRIDADIECECSGEIPNEDNIEIEKETYIATGLKIARNEIINMPVIKAISEQYCSFSPTNEIDNSIEKNIICISKLRKGDIFIYENCNHVLVDYDESNEVAFITTLENYMFVEIQRKGVYGYTNSSFVRIKCDKMVEYVCSIYDRLN